MLSVGDQAPNFDLPDADKERLLNLTPPEYTGLAPDLISNILR